VETLVDDEKAIGYRSVQWNASAISSGIYFISWQPWIRRRLRAKQMKLWKSPKRLHRRLRQIGYSGDFQAIKMSSWRNAGSPLCHMALPNKYFAELGLFDLASVQTGISVST